jgi:hypothetical protein
MSAKHPTDDEEDVSTTDGSEEMTSGFVSDADDAIDGDLMGGDADALLFMAQMLPMTTRRLTEVRTALKGESHFVPRTKPGLVRQSMPTTNHTPTSTSEQSSAMPPSPPGLPE